MLIFYVLVSDITYAVDQFGYNSPRFMLLAYSPSKFKNIGLITAYIFLQLAT